MKHLRKKLTKLAWAIVALIVIISMLIFMVAPAFM
jgi:hypothetical protein